MVVETLQQAAALQAEALRPLAPLALLAPLQQAATLQVQRSQVVQGSLGRRETSWQILQCFGNESRHNLSLDGHASATQTQTNCIHHNYSLASVHSVLSHL